MSYYNKLAEVFDNLGMMFERFSPSAFRFLSAFLPYTTPLPVAWYTMNSAQTFLGFPPFIAFIFVFGLEGMGIWFTSLFVDSIIDFILSRNLKTSILVFLFGLVVAVYIFLLINLNVTLKLSTGSVNPALEKVITLLCFLPLLTGVGNGYYKWKLEQNQKQEVRNQKAEDLQNAIRQEKREDKLKHRMLKAGINPLIQYQATTVSDFVESKTKKKTDWRLLTAEERHEVKYILSPEDIMKKYPISRATAFAWKKK